MQVLPETEGRGPGRMHRLGSINSGRRWDEDQMVKGIKGAAHTKKGSGGQGQQKERKREGAMGRTRKTEPVVLRPRN